MAHHPDKFQSVLGKAVHFCRMCVTFEPPDGIAQDTIMLLCQIQQHVLRRTAYISSMWRCQRVGLSSSQMVLKKVEMSAVVR